MPSTRTSKRVKYTLSKAQADFASITDAASTSSPQVTTHTQNSKALDLPLELLHEILSYFVTFPEIISDAYGSTPEDYLERKDAISALSQTCRLWRDIFFPMLWERLELSTSHSQSGAWYKVHGDALLKRSLLVRENPEIAKHVKSMSVSLSRYSLNTVLPAFVKALKCLPNLQTLQITGVTKYLKASSIKAYFEGEVFPQVRTVVLPGGAHHILRCCPEARKIVCANGGGPSQLLGAIKDSCRKVEVLEGFYGPDNLLKRIPKAVPRLRCMSFGPRNHWGGQSTVASLKLLSGMKHIQQVTLIAHHETFEDAARDPNFATILKLAKEIVRKSPQNQGRKSITIHRAAHWMHYHEPEPVYVQWSKTIGQEELV